MNTLPQKVPGGGGVLPISFKAPFSPRSCSQSHSRFAPSKLLPTTSKQPPFRSSQPQAFTYDAAGNLYIASLKQNVIRRVDLKGIITTVAGAGEQGFFGDGGAATSAVLDSPAGMPLTPPGTLLLDQGASGAGQTLAYPYNTICPHSSLG